jgi:hypothetical protein
LRVHKRNSLLACQAVVLRLRDGGWSPVTHHFANFLIFPSFFFFFSLLDELKPIEVNEVVEANFTEADRASGELLDLTAVFGAADDGRNGHRSLPVPAMRESAQIHRNSCEKSEASRTGIA